MKAQPPAPPDLAAIMARLDQLYDELIDLAAAPASLAVQVAELRNDLRGEPADSPVSGARTDRAVIRARAARPSHLSLVASR